MQIIVFVFKMIMNIIAYISQLVTIRVFRPDIEVCSVIRR